MLESASLPYVSPAEVARLLPYAEAVDELRAAFSEPRRDSPERVRVEIPRGELLLMPAFGPEGVGVKLVTLHGRDSESPHPRVQGIYVLFSADGLAPELILDGAALTERRTAAVSALATQCLARENASRLVVFGTGRQARAHVDAVCSVRDIEYVGIVGHRPGPARVLVDELGERGLPAEVVSAEAVAEADIVCTCTPSTQPLFEDRWLARGVHVNAIGAYREDMCELPAATLAQALLTVEDRGAALVEAGDIIQAIAERAIGPGHIAGDLTDLACGAVGRSSAEQVTVFKSVGIADEDLVLVRMIARAARRTAPRGDDVQAPFAIAWRPMPTILLLRHGQASFGAADYDVLSPLGERQAQAVDAELQRRATTIDHVACGTMRRQRDTLAGLSELPAPAVDPRLNEYSADDILAAHTTSPLRQDAPGDAQIAAAGDSPKERAAASRAFQDVLDDGLRAWIAAGAGGPAGEPFPTFAGRVRAALEETSGQLGSGETALLCTSSGVISAACTTLLGLPDDAFLAFNRVTVNAGITTIALGRRGATLVSFNEHGHLLAGGRSLLSYR